MFDPMRSRRATRLLTTGAVSLLCCAVLPSTATAGPATTATPANPAGIGSAADAPGWVTTWGGSPMTPSPLASSVQSLDNQTVRNIVYTSTGGTQLRIRVSNTFGDSVLTIGAASVARQLRGAQLESSTTRVLTFAGSSSARVQPGQSLLSDPVPFAVPALSTLAVSLYVPQPVAVATYHQDAQQTNYLASGDHATDAADAAFTTTVGTWFLLDAVQVRSAARGTIVAVGDSITDGTAGQVGANTRWPNYLARGLAARYGQSAPAVIDEGISGNRVLSDSPCFGVNLLARLDRDVLDQRGVRSVVLLEGINDLGFSQTPNTGCTAPNTEITPERLIAAYQQIVSRAHAKGIRIYSGTLMPATGFSYWNDAAEAKRLVVNAWILGSHAFDGVVDFAAIMAAPGHPELLDARYDSGDHIHPNDSGYQAMGDAVQRTLTAS